MVRVVVFLVLAVEAEKPVTLVIPADFLVVDEDVLV